MKKYFVNTGNQKEGPYTAEELLIKKITRETMVWTNQYPDWISAGDVPELAAMMRDISPSLKTFGTDTAIPSEARSTENQANMSAFFWTILLLAVIVAIVIISR